MTTPTALLDEVRSAPTPEVAGERFLAARRSYWASLDTAAGRRFRGDLAATAVLAGVRIS